MARGVGETRSAGSGTGCDRLRNSRPEGEAAISVYRIEGGARDAGGSVSVRRPGPRGRCQRSPPM